MATAKVKKAKPKTKHTVYVIVAPNERGMVSAVGYLSLSEVIADLEYYPGGEVYCFDVPVRKPEPKVIKPVQLVMKGS